MSDAHACNQHFPAQKKQAEIAVMYHCRPCMPLHIFANQAEYFHLEAFLSPVMTKYGTVRLTWDSLYGVEADIILRIA